MIPTFFGDEFLVNTTTADTQFRPAITSLANGRFVVTWIDNSETGGDTDNGAVRAQVFNADGSKSGPEFLVNTTTAGGQLRPAIAGLPDGRFVAAWNDNSNTGGDTSSTAIRAQIFNPDGSKSGVEFLVNSLVSNGQFDPAITTLTGGGFVVTWTDNSKTAPDTSGAAIRGQIFDGNAGKVGAEFLVNTTTNTDQVEPTIAALNGGGFVIAWTDNSLTAGDMSGSAVRAQVFDANGAKTGGETLVNTTAANNQNQAAVAALANDRFIIAWTDESQSAGDTSGSAIRAQIFSANGAKSGSEFLVNTTVTGNQTDPAVAGLPDGRFIVAWSDESQSGGDTSEAAVRAQVFNANGTKSGEEFLVNSATTSAQAFPAITVLADGRIVIAWEDDSNGAGDSSPSAVRGQIFDPRLEGVVLTGTKLADDWIGTVFKDVMKGKGGADTFDGGASKDKLVGGKGPDGMTGGLGPDRFIFKSIKDSKKKESDAILDFSRKEKDKIVLAGIDAVKGGKDNKFDYIGKDKFSGDAGELKYKVKQGDALVMGDVTGNGKADFAILVEDVTKLKDGDFML